MYPVEKINSTLISHLESNLPDHDFRDVLKYAVLPPGKLFRPQLIYALAEDLESLNENHKFFASSIEIHHSYTLVHDDLPAMDDDDYRRGKLSTHKKFGQWQAILAGDALLGMSYGILSNIDSPKLNELLRSYHEYTGASGLILGQVLDLESKDSTLQDIIRIHTLKTARLIQLSLVGSNILSDKPIACHDCKSLGLSIGVLFQLIDDLTELTEDINEHERKINPYLNYELLDIEKCLETEFNKMNSILNDNKLENLNSIITSYLAKMNNKITIGEEKIKTYLSEISLDRLKKIITIQL